MPNNESLDPAIVDMAREAFNEAWHAADDAGDPDRSLQGMESALSLVSPLIAAKALREAAEAIDRDRPGDWTGIDGYDSDGRMPDGLSIPEWLRTRADALEAGQS